MNALESLSNYRGIAESLIDARGATQIASPVTRQAGCDGLTADDETAALQVFKVCRQKMPRDACKQFADFPVALFT